MKFYAYIPREDGTAPCGTSDQTIFELKTKRGAINRGKRILGGVFRLFSYTNLYDDTTLLQIACYGCAPAERVQNKYVH